MKDRFNFEEFDNLCREVLPDYEEQDVKMAAEDIKREEDEMWWEHDHPRLPGEIGGVAVTPLYREWFGDEPVTEDDIRIEGDPEKVIYDPNQQSLW